MDSKYIIQAGMYKLMTSKTFFSFHQLESTKHRRIKYTIHILSVRSNTDCNAFILSKWNFRNVGFPIYYA